MTDALRCCECGIAGHQWDGMANDDETCRDAALALLAECRPHVESQLRRYECGEMANWPPVQLAAAKVRAILERMPP